MAAPGEENPVAQKQNGEEYFSPDTFYVLWILNNKNVLPEKGKRTGKNKDVS